MSLPVVQYNFIFEKTEDCIHIPLPDSLGNNQRSNYILWDRINTSFSAYKLDMDTLCQALTIKTSLNVRIWIIPKIVH